jgi:heterodisulfide reductase subunit A-like polyferredoxin
MRTTDAIVIGAGVAGVACARELARAGLAVTLLERNERPGGNAAGYCCQALDFCTECGICLGLEELAALERTPGVSLMTDCEPVRLEGEAGDFRLTVRLSPPGGPAGQESINAKGIVLAGGFTPFDPAGQPEYGYGFYPNVVTIAQVEEEFRRNGKIAKADGAPPERIALIHCVGSRDLSRSRNYCSRFCCASLVRLSRLIRRQLSDTRMTLFYMDLQPVGRGFDEFLREAENEGIGRIRCLPAKVFGSAATKRLTIAYVSPECGRLTREDFDLVVLAHGMHARAQAPETAALLGLETDEHGFVIGADEGVGRSARRGVYLAGSCAGPVTVSESLASARATAGALAADLAAGGARAEAAPDEAKPVLVVGAGLAGLSVAAELVRRGVPVTVVDRWERAGGRAAGCARLLPWQPRPQAMLTERLSALHERGGRLLLGSRVERVSGFAGNFSACIRTAQGADQQDYSAIVLALGHTAHYHADAAGLPLGERVQTFSQFERTIGAVEQGRAALPDTVAIVTDLIADSPVAVGEAALTFAHFVQAEQSKQAILICRNVKVAAPGLEALFGKVRDAGALVFKFPERPAFAVEPQGVSIILASEPFGGTPEAELRLHCDLVVVAEEVGPPDEAQPFAQMLGLTMGTDGFLQPPNVRMGPGRTNRRGVFAVGTCRQPMTVAETLLEASLVAHQIAVWLARGDEVWETPLAEVDEDKCALCLTCLRSCPHGAVLIEERAEAAKIMPSDCQGCGICVADCPSHAITLRGYERAALVEQVTFA